jgi:hypothetical protein
MRTYPVMCQTRGCVAPATRKVASAWSDGQTTELKTYALCCDSCLAEWYERAIDSWRTCRLTVGERLDRPGIYERFPVSSRRPDLER